MRDFVCGTDSIKNFLPDADSGSGRLLTPPCAVSGLIGPLTWLHNMGSSIDGPQTLLAVVLAYHQTNFCLRATISMKDAQHPCVGILHDSLEFASALAPIQYRSSPVTSVAHLMQDWRQQRTDFHHSCTSCPYC
jgi:hypothetical protein